MTYSNTAFILLGGNINPRFTYLKKAESKISTVVGHIISKSNIYETEAWGFESEDNFLNEVLLVETNLSANSLLKELLEIEKSLGRKRNEGEAYSSRTLDADILYYNNDIIDEEDLSIPHPRLHLRKFVLEPLCEIAANYVHPKLKMSNKVLLKNCDDKSRVIKMNNDEL
ncbi:MAG: 2-amino-4-hydroxy-6-hydroxymethyldihydropteridine diphosphokinase [Marinilabiliales bacterium]|nr:MAG: 2-amino-4-hydroxy-6-hydroxymethyldihydropteridine diphosphokinase [Marinilabiliales bacterium]